VGTRLEEAKNNKLTPFLPCVPVTYRKALDTGYRHIDCASLYFNEEMVGKELAEWVASAPENRREDVFVTSKVGEKFD